MQKKYQKTFHSDENEEIFTDGEINKEWIKYNKGTDTVIVFVHGFLSNSADCWKGKSGKSWPDLINLDEKFKSCAIFSCDYHTTPNSGEYDIEQATNELFNRFRYEPSPKYQSIFSFKNILFVCHSLGGILIRRLVEQQKHLLIEKSIGLFLVASPSGGSEYAKTFASLGRIYKNKIARQLNINSDILADLDGRFRNLIHQRTIPRLVGAEVSENYGPIWSKWLPIRTPPIVKKSSSSRYFGSATIIPDSDHFSIAKPENSNSTIYISLLRFFEQEFKPVANLPLDDKKIISPSNNSTRPFQSNALFDIYKSDCNPYYLARNADSSLAEILKYSSVWICGPSGCGKTSMARHRIFSASEASYLQIDLGSIRNSVEIEEYYETIVATYRSRGLTNVDLESYSIGDVVEIVANAHKNDSIVRILIDEIPMPITGETSITEFLLNLVVKVNAASAASIRFIICSIHPPSKSSFTDKLQESLRIHTLNMWSQDELMKLVELIEISTGLALGSENTRLRLISLDQCTPRKIKNFFRRLVALGGASVENIENTLLEFESN